MQRTKTILDWRPTMLDRRTLLPTSAVMAPVRVPAALCESTIQSPGSKVARLLVRRTVEFIQLPQMAMCGERNRNGLKGCHPTGRVGEEEKDQGEVSSKYLPAHNLTTRYNADLFPFLQRKLLDPRPL